MARRVAALEDASDGNAAAVDDLRHILERLANALLDVDERVKHDLAAFGDRLTEIEDRLSAVEAQQTDLYGLVALALKRPESLRVRFGKWLTK